ATMTGAKLDYGVALKPSRFRIPANPNTPLRCPCNRSFGAEWPGRGQPDCQSQLPMPGTDEGGSPAGRPASVTGDQRYNGSDAARSIPRHIRYSAR
ncbi:MAG TPA: hypothetical protein VGS41_08940, partial [Chthonomonadales bacterium]|nr:hypothetical protein [Chthonomonadales bacterium]